MSPRQTNARSEAAQFWTWDVVLYVGWTLDFLHPVWSAPSHPHSGVVPQRRATPGGQHPGLGTRNALIALGPSMYLEIVGPDPEQPKPLEPRWFCINDLAAPRLVAWAAKSERTGRGGGRGLAKWDRAGHREFWSQASQRRNHAVLAAHESAHANGRRTRPFLHRLGIHAASSPHSRRWGITRRSTRGTP